MTNIKLVEHFLTQLQADESWQGTLTDGYRAIWLNAAGCHLRLAFREHGDLEKEYRRVKRALGALSISDECIETKP